MRAHAVMDRCQYPFGQLQRLLDALLLETGYRDDFAAVRQDARNHQPAVMPAEVLVHRTVLGGTLFQENNVVQGQHQWCGTAHRGRVARAVQQVGADFAHGARQCDLLPERIGGATDLDDMEIRTLAEATVFSRAHEDVILVLGVELLQSPDGFERNEVHAVLVGTEDALCFDGYFHGLRVWFWVMGAKICLVADRFLVPV